jgi:hypothetical protein
MPTDSGVNRRTRRTRVAGKLLNMQQNRLSELL